MCPMWIAYIHFFREFGFRIWPIFNQRPLSGNGLRSLIFAYAKETNTCSLCLPPWCSHRFMRSLLERNVFAICSLYAEFSRHSCTNVHIVIDEANTVVFLRFLCVFVWEPTLRDDVENLEEVVRHTSFRLAYIPPRYDVSDITFALSEMFGNIRDGGITDNLRWYQGENLPHLRLRTLVVCYLLTIVVDDFQWQFLYHFRWNSFFCPVNLTMCIQCKKASFLLAWQPFRGRYRCSRMQWQHAHIVLPSLRCCTLS